MKKDFLRVLVFFILLSPLHAQVHRQYTENYNSWFIYTGSHKLSNKWGIHLEGQVRRSDWVTGDQQLIFRTGINYHVNAQVFLTAGYCFVETYPYGGFPAKTNFPEHRIWEQIQIKNSIGIIEFINRIRLEQRYVNIPILKEGEYVPGDAVYYNRIRLLNRFSLPFKGKTIEDKSFYLSFSDEIFINFGENAGYNILDQNRGYIGIGYKIPKAGRLEIGYLNQLLFKSDGIKVENNHTIQIGLASSIEFRNKKE